MRTSGTSGTSIINLIILLCVIALNTLLIMVIWNSVLIKKIRGANLQKLSFWDSLAISIFFSLISGGTVVYNQTK
jgi:hypothetical protein